MTDAPAIHKFFVYQFMGEWPELNRAHGHSSVPEMCFHQLSSRDKEKALELLEKFQVTRVYSMMQGTTLRYRWQLKYLKRQMTIKACANLGSGYNIRDELVVQFYAIIRMIDTGMINQDLFKVQVNTGNDIETAVFIICRPICKMISQMMQSVDQFMPVVALDAVRNLPQLEYNIPRLICMFSLLQTFNVGQYYVTQASALCPRLVVAEHRDQSPILVVSKT